MPQPLNQSNVNLEFAKYIKTALEKNGLHPSNDDVARVAKMAMDSLERGDASGDLKTIVWGIVDDITRPMQQQKQQSSPEQAQDANNTEDQLQPAEQQRQMQSQEDKPTELQNVSNTEYTTVDKKTGLSVKELCKFGENLATLIRKGMYSLGYIQNIDYKINHATNTSICPYLDDYKKAFSEAYPTFSPENISKIAESNCITVFSLNQEINRAVTQVIKADPALRGSFTQDDNFRPQIDKVPYNTYGIRLRNENQEIVGIINSTIYFGKTRTVLNLKGIANKFMQLKQTMSGIGNKV